MNNDVITFINLNEILEVGNQVALYRDGVEMFHSRVHLVRKDFVILANDYIIRATDLGSGSPYSLICDGASCVCTRDALPPYSNTEGYANILNELLETYSAKNNDYGSAIEASIREIGLVYTVSLLSNKYKRIYNLVCNQAERKVKDESIEDTLLDMAGYALETVRVLRVLREEEKESKGLCKLQ